MTDERFDDLTRRMATTTSRRSVLKGVMATALSGVALRLRGGSNDAEARARVRMACARLGQACATGTGTPGNMLCCPQLTCGSDAVCCKDTNYTCVNNDDCCGDNTCRPNPSGLGNRCLPPGDLGAECQEDPDCAGVLACETTTGMCGVICGDTICQPSQTCDSYTLSCINLLAAESFGDATGGPTTWRLTANNTTGQGFAGVSFALDAPIDLVEIDELATDYTFDTGDSCCGGSPRYQLGTPAGNIFVAIGDPPSFNTCPSDTPLSTGNLIGNDDACRFDTSQIQSGTQCNTYDGTVALLNSLSLQITDISLVADGYWCTPDGDQGVTVDPTVILV